MSRLYHIYFLNRPHKSASEDKIPCMNLLEHSSADVLCSQKAARKFQSPQIYQIRKHNSAPGEDDINALASGPGRG